MWFDNPEHITVDAEFIESSATGFRLAHDSDALEPGLEVSWESEEGRGGKALVIWTHVAQDRRVSGFVAL